MMTGRHLIWILYRRWCAMCAGLSRRRDCHFKQVSRNLSHMGACKQTSLTKNYLKETHKIIKMPYNWVNKHCHTLSGGGTQITFFTFHCLLKCSTFLPCSTVPDRWWGCRSRIECLLTSASRSCCCYSGCWLRSIRRSNWFDAFGDYRLTCLIYCTAHGVNCFCFLR